MSETAESDPDGERITGAGASVRDSDIDITRRVVLAAFGGGLAGVVLMSPVVVGVPLLLGIFRTEPLVEVAELGAYVGLDPSLPLGLAVFVLGGTIVLPLLFLTAGTYLPPHEPRWTRGLVFASIMWTGFVIAYYPGGDALTAGAFVVLSLIGHWVYGGTLGYVLERVAGIPEHDV